MGCIYKITNKINNKCYIGETKKPNPELRWNEHKRTIEKGIGCPALQDAVKKYGIENFKFEVLIICFDEDRFKFEKEYIKKYNSIAPNGYNLTPGGEGGGFYGKKHNEITINKIKNTLKERYENNPELRKENSERAKLLFKNENNRIKIRNAMKNSEKWKNAKKGNTNNKKHTKSVIDKLKIKTQDYFNNIENIKKHREIMAKATGVKVSQYDLDNNFIRDFVSIKEASRETGIPCSTLGKAIRLNISVAGNYIWKKE